MHSKQQLRVSHASHTNTITGMSANFARHIGQMKSGGGGVGIIPG